MNNKASQGAVGAAGPLATFAVSHKIVNGLSNEQEGQRQMKAFGGANYRENAAKCGDLDPCAYCGRAIKKTSKAISVEVCCCGSFMDAPGHVGCKAGSQGGFRMGADCAKKYRRFKEVNSVGRSALLRTTLESDL